MKLPNREIVADELEPIAQALEDSTALVALCSQESSAMAAEIIRDAQCLLRQEQPKDGEDTCQRKTAGAVHYVPHTHFEAGKPCDDCEKRERMLALPEVLGMPDGLHPQTRRLVQGFALALAAKLHAAQKKYGYTDGWSATDWIEECRVRLREHLEKGDPRDVAAYCAFLWFHNEPTRRDGEPCVHPQLCLPCAERTQQAFREISEEAYQRAADKLKHDILDTFAGPLEAEVSRLDWYDLAVGALDAAFAESLNPLKRGDYGVNA